MYKYINHYKTLQWQKSEQQNKTHWPIIIPIKLHLRQSHKGLMISNSFEIIKNSVNNGNSAAVIWSNRAKIHNDGFKSTQFRWWYGGLQSLHIINESMAQISASFSFYNQQSLDSNLISMSVMSPTVHTTYSVQTVSNSLDRHRHCQAFATTNNLQQPATTINTTVYKWPRQHQQQTTSRSHCSHSKDSNWTNYWTSLNIHPTDTCFDWSSKMLQVLESLIYIQ